MILQRYKDICNFLSGILGEPDQLPLQDSCIFCLDIFLQAFLFSESIKVISRKKLAALLSFYYGSFFFLKHVYEVNIAYSHV